MSDGTRNIILDKMKKDLSFYDEYKNIIISVMDKYTAMRVALIRSLIDEIITHNN